MYFLPDQDIAIAWTPVEQGHPRTGHCWYDGQYCYFELDSSQWDGESCWPIYCVFSMKGESLVRELARRKWSELEIDGSDATSGSIQFPAGTPNKREADLEFIGRFAGFDVNQFAGDVVLSEQANNSGWRGFASIVKPWRAGFGQHKAAPTTRDRVFSRH